MKALLKNFYDQGLNYPCDKRGLRSPAQPDELIIKRATQLSVSVTIKATFITNLSVGESGYLGFTFT